MVQSAPSVVMTFLATLASCRSRGGTGCDELESSKSAFTVVSGDTLCASSDGTASSHTRVKAVQFVSRAKDQEKLFEMLASTTVQTSGLQARHLPDKRSLSAPRSFHTHTHKKKDPSPPFLSVSSQKKESVEVTDYADNLWQL